jgi:CMP-N-acetylneuraminic acid synthetase
LPDKNVLPFCGKPLWRWTYDAAKGSKYISDVVVSTDDERIVAALPDCAVSVRLPGLCGDGVSSEDVMLYEIEKQKELGYEYDYVLLLQPTSPLRNADDIDDMIKYAIDHKYHAVASGYKLSKPVYQCTLLRDAIVMNGAMYLIRMDRFLKYKSVSTMLDDIYLMPEERSADIDTLYDFEVARLQYKFMRKMRCKDAVGAST